MTKLKISAKELRTLGYPESPVIPVAMNVMEKHFKHYTKEEAFEILKAVLQSPKDYATDEVPPRNHVGWFFLKKPGIINLKMINSHLFIFGNTELEIQ